MNFHVIGVNHNSAPLEVRERLAVPEAQLPDAIRSLVQQPGVDEGMVLSTCNRVEVVTSTKQGADLRGFLGSYFGVSPTALNSHIYEFEQREAVRHVFRVASSLDSMVVGEPQILGQVKEAYALARGIGCNPFRAGSAAITRFCRGQARALRDFNRQLQRFHCVRGRAAGGKDFWITGRQDRLSGGRGQDGGAGGAAPDRPRRKKHHCVAIARIERAVELAEEFGGRAVSFDQLHETSDSADIILTSTGAPEPIFRREHGERLMKGRRNRPMFFIDIAVPRNVHPDMNKLDGMFVYDVDDLQSVATDNAGERKKEAERAEKIIELEVDRFASRMKSLAVVPDDSFAPGIL